MANNGSKELISFIRQKKLFQELNDEELDLLLNVMEKKFFTPGEYIIREQENDQHIFILYKGRAEIKKESPPHPPFQIGYLEPGELFGEMSLLEGGVRSASVIAIEPSEVLAFNVIEIEQLHNKIIKGLGSHVSAILRKTDQDLVTLLVEKIQDYQIRAQASNLLIALILSTSFYIIAQKITTLLFGTFTIPTLSLFGFGVVLFQSIAVFLIILDSKYPIEFYGVTLQNWKKDTWEAILATIPVLIIFIVMKWFLINFIPLFESAPLFEIFPEKELYQENYFLFSLVYLIFIPIQEFLVRGIFQGCLRNFFIGRYKILLAIVGSNLIFASEHVVKSLIFAAGVFILGLYWGYLYQKQNSLVGVSVSHAIVAAWVFYILNISRFFVL